jgi:hypothetical protein
MKKTKRTVLVILSDRIRPEKTVRYFELDCLEDGTVEREERLKRRPTKPVYDEVWENDDGRSDLDSCNRMRRHYKHKLLKPKE